MAPDRPPLRRAPLHPRVHASRGGWPHRRPPPQGRKAPRHGPRMGATRNPPRRRSQPRGPRRPDLGMELIMPWTGQIATSYLNDHQIRASEYRKWEHARRQFARGRDRKTVDAYKAEIQGNGGRLRTPIRLSVDDRTHEVVIGDGH